MIKPKRINLAGYIYHVICRADQDDVVFTNDKDKESFLEYLGDYVQQFPMRVYAGKAAPGFIHKREILYWFGNRSKKYIKFINEGLDSELKSFILSQRFMGSEEFEIQAICKISIDIYSDKMLIIYCYFDLNI